MLHFVQQINEKKLFNIEISPFSKKKKKPEVANVGSRATRNLASA